VACVSTRAINGWLERHRAALAAAILGAVAVSLAVLALPRPPAPQILVQQPPARPVASALVPTPVLTLIVVHLSGEIMVPGIYQLPVGARIDDAVRVAGGVTANGDVNRLNLAARLADGQHVVVPRKTDPVAVSAMTSASPAAVRINVNEATVAELDGLPGVGPVTAQRIVAYRQQHGPFTRIDELRDAKLVNQVTFDKIKDLITL
jgi:competence protein ComEA